MTQKDDLFDTLDDILFRPEQAKKPASKWRNKWRNRFRRGSPIYDVDGRLVTDYLAPGGEIFDLYIWPSKEVAEQKATDHVALCEKEGDATLEYLGAFEME